MSQSRRLVAIMGMTLICAVFGHNIRFISLDGALFVIGIVLICFSILPRRRIPE